MITTRLTILPGLPSLLRSLSLAGLGLGLCSLPLAAQQPQTPPAGADAAAEDPFAVDEGDYFLLKEPETPEEFFKGTVQAHDLGRPNLARLYLQKFLELDPPDDVLLKLRDQYGPAAFARLANQPELQPLSTQLNARVNEVFRERGASPERIEALMEGLGGAPNEALAAREALTNAGESVIPAILTRLKVEQDKGVRSQLVDALVGMKRTALPALHAAIESPDESLRIQILAILGRIGSSDSVPYLYYPAYGPEQSVGVQTAARRALEEIAQVSQSAIDAARPADVAARLRETAIRTISTPPPAADPAATPALGGVRSWSWDPAAETVTSTELPAREARLWDASRFAREAFRVAPDRPATQSLYLALLLEREARDAKTFEPPAAPGTAFNLLLAGGPAAARNVLDDALANGLPRAAFGALSVLSKTATPASLHGDDQQLIKALNAGDPRVQLGAAVAILRMNSDRSIPHAGRVVEILARALSSDPDPAAVIIDPNEQRGSTLAGFVRELGYSSQYASSGQEGFRLATERSEPAFILVNLNVSRWPLTQTIANFRADARTKDIPVVVVGPAEGDWEAEPVASSRYAYFRGPGIRDPRAKIEQYVAQTDDAAYIVETTTTAAFAAQLQPVIASLVVEPVSAAERAEARQVAVYWLAQIADTGRAARFPLEPAESALVSALADPDLSANAQIALAAIPTATAQAALARNVLAPVADGDLQRSAVDLLTDHVRRFGILLPKSTVADMNRLWATTQDQALRTALAGWGGALQPGATITQERLEQLPVPGLPTPAAAP